MTAPPRRARRPNPFQVLGIPPTSTPAEITAAYRALAKKYHPDLYQERPERVRRAAEQRMQQLNEAYKQARANPRRGVDGTEYGASSTPWTGSDVGAWSRTARRSGETEAARRARLVASREQAERAAREHISQARMYQRLRQEARKSARYGDAVARSKSKLVMRVPSTLYGAGQAAHSNEVMCRGCQVIQRLPPDWQERLNDTAFFCSNCDRVLLNR